MRDTKSGKRHNVASRLFWRKGCELGFRGTLGEWDRLMGAAPLRRKMGVERKWAALLS